MGLKIQRLLTESAHLQFQKGFTLIGVLVAAAVGVIVIAGVSQMFANMAGQLKQMEDRTKRIFFDRFVGAEFAGGACKSTLRDNNVALATGSAISFSQLRNEAGRIVLDLGAEKERLESQFGITGNVHFIFSCNDPQPDGSPDCDCESAAPPFPCVRTWTLSLITQKKVKGLFVYDKGLSVQVVIRYPQKPSDPLSPPLPPPAEPWESEAYNHFECTDSLLISGGGSVDCYEVEDSGKNLVGCGTTTDNPANTTAFGFNAGHSGTGQFNTLIGYEAGKSTAGDSNTFLGYEAGKDNTTGNGNTFVGKNAGSSNLTGVENTFVGHSAGQSNTANENTFLGHSAGLSNTTGTNNIFIGYKAGQATTTGGGNVFLGNSAGENNTASLNFFLGTGAGQTTTTGGSNVFLGNTTGKDNTTGSENLFLGRSAGRDRTSGDKNVIIGAFAGAVTTSGDNNIFIGDRAGNLPLYATTSGQFIVGNNSNRDWIVGTIGSNTISVSGINICLEDGTNCPTTASAGTPAHTHAPSSRTVKKNIKPFKNFKKALGDILKPIFSPINTKIKKCFIKKNAWGLFQKTCRSICKLKRVAKPPDRTGPAFTALSGPGSKPCIKNSLTFKQKLYPNSKV